MTRAVEPPWTLTPSIYGPFATLRADPDLPGRRRQPAPDRVGRPGGRRPGLAGRALAAAAGRAGSRRAASRRRALDRQPARLRRRACSAPTWTCWRPRWPWPRSCWPPDGPGSRGCCSGPALSTKVTYGVAGLAILWSWRALERRAALRRAARPGGRRGRRRAAAAPLGRAARLRAAAALAPVGLPGHARGGRWWRLLTGPLPGATVRNLVFAAAVLVMVVLAVLLARVAGAAPATATGSALRATFVLTTAYVLAAPYSLPWYDVLTMATLPALAATPLDALLTARWVVVTLAYVPGRVVAMSAGVEAFTLGVRRSVAPYAGWLVWAWWRGWRGGRGRVGGPGLVQQRPHADRDHQRQGERRADGRDRGARVVGGEADEEQHQQRDQPRAQQRRPLVGPLQRPRPPGRGAGQDVDDEDQADRHQQGQRAAGEDVPVLPGLAQDDRRPRRRRSRSARTGRGGSATPAGAASRRTRSRAGTAPCRRRSAGPGARSAAPRATASTKKARAGRNAGGPPKSLPQAGDASTTTAARPIAATAPTATGRRPARTKWSRHRDAQHDRGGGEQREGDVAHAVEPAADHRLQAHQRGQLQPRPGHHVGGQHEHRGGRDDARAARTAQRRHGPSRATEEMTATNTPTEPTTASIGLLKRHHGSRLARKVDTGTAAAMIATRSTSRSSRSRVSSEPHRRRQHHRHERVDEDLHHDPAVEERRDQASAPRARPGRSRPAAAAGRRRPPRRCRRPGRTRSGLPLTPAGSGQAGAGQDRRGEVGELDQPGLPGGGGLQRAGAARPGPRSAASRSRSLLAGVGQARDQHVGAGRCGGQHLPDPGVDRPDLRGPRRRSGAPRRPGPRRPGRAPRRRRRGSRGRPPAARGGCARRTARSR